MNEYEKVVVDSIWGIWGAKKLLADIEFHEWFEELSQWVEKEFATR